MTGLPAHEDWIVERPFPLAVARWPWGMETLERVLDAWPGDDDPGWTAHRTLKRSYGPNGAAAAATVRPIVERLHSPEFIEALTRMTGIVGLRPDPLLRGGGLHETSPGGRLGMHVDFNRQDGLWRRLNVLVYLNRDVPDTSGDLRLESDDAMTVRRISPQMGTMVVFETTDKSWHGHPTPLTWDHSRRSFAAYYYSPLPPAGAEREHSTIYRGEDKHKGGKGEVQAKPPPDPAKWIPKPAEGPTEPLGCVTTFNAGLYEATGKALLASWLRSEQWRYGPMLVCTEGDPPLPSHESLRVCRLEDDEFLRAWLTANQDIIPTYFGGTATKCRCLKDVRRGPRRMKGDKTGHRPGCHWNDSNRFASRWFRKVAAVRQAVVRLAVDRILWLDSDVVIRKAVDPEAFDSCLAGQSLFYMLGGRESIESGVYGFLPRTSDIVPALVRRYMTGGFRKLRRWDDGFVMAELARQGHVTGADIVAPESVGHVLRKSCLADLLRHAKGSHKRRRKYEAEAAA